MSEILKRLARLYSFEAPDTNALALILRENIGYLIDDTRRNELFFEFERRVGLDAAKIAQSPEAVLHDIARRGGMRPQARVERWRRIAEIILTECGGDLDARLRSLPVAGARKLLKRFPAIGDPGADRVLLFCGLDVRPALDCNGLRVLVRLGLAAAGPPMRRAIAPPSVVSRQLSPATATSPSPPICCSANMAACSAGAARRIARHARWTLLAHMRPPKGSEHLRSRAASC
ncbi:MAG TPA: hypothetical protein VMF67_02525 [Rhizomicrobium sp.]|nr:hypothetical protein [Rhizomicrobium sp.]